MKKLFLIMALFVVGMAVQAQTVTTQMAKGQTYAEVKTDYVLTNAVVQWWQVNSMVDYMTAQDVIVHLDSADGNHTNVALAIYGKKSALTATWTAIGSAINWKGTTADTTIIFSNTTENGYRYYKILLTGTGTGKTTIANMELKLWYGTP